MGIIITIAFGVGIVGVSCIAILFKLGKISRQLDNILTLFKLVDKKSSGSKAKEDITASQIQRQLHELGKQLKAKKGDVDWKD